MALIAVNRAGREAAVIRSVPFIVVDTVGGCPGRMVVNVSVANQSDRPEFTSSPAGARAPPRAHLRAYLGTVPDYSQSEVTGVSLSGVSKGGPAERAGLRAGDIVVELGGRRIENIYDYTFAIEALRVGEPVSVVVLRGGKTQTFTVTPESRD